MLLLHIYFFPYEYYQQNGVSVAMLVNVCSGWAKVLCIGMDTISIWFLNDSESFRFYTYAQVHAVSYAIHVEQFVLAIEAMLTSITETKQCVSFWCSLLRIAKKWSKRRREVGNVHAHDFNGVSHCLNELRVTIFNYPILFPTNFLRFRSLLCSYSALFFLCRQSTFPNCIALFGPALL